MLRLINICSVFVSFCFNLSKFCIKNVAGWTEEIPPLKQAWWFNGKKLTEELEI